MTSKAARIKLRQNAANLARKKALVSKDESQFSF
jgi:hypothetical protein